MTSQTTMIALLFKSIEIKNKQEGGGEKEEQATDKGQLGQQLRKDQTKIPQKKKKKTKASISRPQPLLAEKLHPPQADSRLQPNRPKLTPTRSRSPHQSAPVRRSQPLLDQEAPFSNGDYQP